MNNNNKETLRTQISMLIQKRIREGVYKPGEKIVETRLCKELSVSQAPVREAFLELSIMGLLEERPYSGTFVKNVLPDEVSDIYNIRAFLEEYAVRRACTHGTDEALKEIEEIVERMDKCESREEFVVPGRLFHEGVLRASGSGALLKCWNSLQVTQWTYQSILNTSKNLKQLAADHRKILEAILARQDHTAGAMIFLHIRGFAEEITEYLRNNGSMS